MKFLIVMLVTMLVALQFRIWVGEGSLAEVWRLTQSIKAQTSTNAELRERNDQLLAEVMDLKEGLEAVEERARRELGMIHRDEVFYQIIAE